MRLPHTTQPAGLSAIIGLLLLACSTEEPSGRVLDNATTSGGAGSQASNSGGEAEAGTGGSATGGAVSSSGGDVASETGGMSSEGTGGSPLNSDGCDIALLALHRRDGQLSRADADMCLDIRFQHQVQATCEQALQFVVDLDTCLVTLREPESHTFTSRGGSTYTVGTTCLEAQDSEDSAAESPATAVTDCNGSETQNWELQVSADDRVQLRSASQDRCLALAEGTPGTALVDCNAQEATLRFIGSAENTGELNDTPEPGHIGSANAWSTAGTKLQLTSVLETTGFAVGPELTYLEQTEPHAEITFDLTSIATTPLLLQPLYMTPFPGVSLRVFQDDQEVGSLQLNSSGSWNILERGPSVVLQVTAGATTRVRLQSATALPIQFESFFLSAPLPEAPAHFADVTPIANSGTTTIPADAFNDLYRLPPQLDEETGAWTFGMPWSRAYVSYLFTVQEAGTYELGIQYVASARRNDTETFGRRIVLDGDQENAPVMQVEENTSGVYTLDLDLSAGVHSVAIQHARLDLGELASGPIATSDLTLTRK